MSSVETVTDATFQQRVLASTKPVMVDFWKPSCGPCRMLAPVLERIASAQDRLDIVTLNVEENPQTTAAYRVTSLPVLKVFTGGRVTKTVIGAKSKAFLLEELQEFIGEPAQR
jgi:thioredoxin 1